MTFYITSDSHFNHNNIFDFEDRPFSTLDEMHEKMIEAWNAVVRKNDTVYHLGDFSFGNAEQWQETLNQLRGNIVLIKGNHDKSKITKAMLKAGLLAEYHPLGTIIKRDGMILNLSHYPMLIGARPRNFSIHGHLHSEETGYTNHINVGVDSAFTKSLELPFGTPIELDKLVEHLQLINPIVEAEREFIRSQRANQE